MEDINHSHYGMIIDQPCVEHVLESKSLVKAIGIQWLDALIFIRLISYN